MLGMGAAPRGGRSAYEERGRITEKRYFIKRRMMKKK
jgi:hypothetical protein